MKSRFVAILCMICLFTPVVHARLGTTKAECVKRYKIGKCFVENEWYVLNDIGMVLKRKAAPSQNNIPMERLTFVNTERRGIQVTVDLINDKVVRILYEAIEAPLDYQTYVDLLDKNKENGQWRLSPDDKKLPPCKKGNPFYDYPDENSSVKRSDGGYASVYSGLTLVISSPAFTSVVEKAKKLNENMKQVRQNQAEQERKLKMNKLNQQKQNL